MVFSYIYSKSEILEMKNCRNAVNYSGFGDFWRRFGGGGGASTHSATDALKSSELTPFGIRIMLIFL